MGVYALARTTSPTLVTEYETVLPSKALLRRKLHELYAQLAPAEAGSNEAKRRRRRPRPRWRMSSGELVKRGMRPDGPTGARRIAANSRRWWRNSGKAINIAFPISYFDNLGLPRLAATSTR